MKGLALLGYALWMFGTEIARELSKRPKTHTDAVKGDQWRSQLRSIEMDVYALEARHLRAVRDQMHTTRRGAQAWELAELAVLERHLGA